MTEELRVHFNEEPDESLSLTKDFHRVIRMLPSDFLISSYDSLRGSDV